MADLSKTDLRLWDDSGTRLEVLWDSGGAYLTIVRYGESEDDEHVVNLTDKQLRELVDFIGSEVKAKARSK